MWSLVIRRMNGEKQSFDSKHRESMRKRVSSNLTCRLCKAPCGHRSEESKKPIRVMMVGKMGQGKSETARTLMYGAKANSQDENQKYFKASNNLHSVTQVIETHEFRYDNRDFQLLDSPGLFDPSRSNQDILNEVEKFNMEAAGGGIDVFLYVCLWNGRAEKDTIKELWKTFNTYFDGAGEHTVLGLTKMGPREWDGARVNDVQAYLDWRSGEVKVGNEITKQFCHELVKEKLARALKGEFDCSREDFEEIRKRYSSSKREMKQELTIYPGKECTGYTIPEGARATFELDDERRRFESMREDERRTLCFKVRNFGFG